MKFIHLADLHLGKSLYGVSLIDNGDQNFWVERFLEKTAGILPDAVVIAGDIYDRSAPSGDAVMLFNHMLTELEKMNIPVMITAGNHDSGQRLSFAESILAKQQIYIAGVAQAEVSHVTIAEKDGPGEVTFWLVPYLFPAMAAQKLEDDSIGDYETAMRKLLERQDIDFNRRNVLVAHQNVTADGREAERGGSESMVGGVGQMDYRVFDGFDYVALGHIHASCPVGRKEVRYAGSPLCYHFDETRQPVKGILLVELKEKGSGAHVTPISVSPLHPMREIRGTCEEILKEAEDGKEQQEYIKIVVTDSRITPQLSGMLRELFGKRGSIIMELVSEFREFGRVSGLPGTHGEAKEIEEYFEELYRERKAQAEPDEKDRKLFAFAAARARGRQKAEKREEELQKDAEELLAYILEQEAGKE